MINRLLDFLNASPVNFLAAKNIASELEKNGYRRIDPTQPLGKVKAGDKLYVTKSEKILNKFGFSFGYWYFDFVESTFVRQ